MLSLTASKRTQKHSIGILVEQVSPQQQSHQAKSNKFPYYGILINTLLIWKSFMKIKQITENTTSGSISTVETSLGGTQSRGNPSIYGGKKVGSLFKGKKTKAPYANSVNESAELSEAHLEEDDIIVVPGQGRNRKNGLVPHGQSRLDHEVEMARSDLFQAAKNAIQVYSMIKDVGEEEGLEGWVQEKIIKANDYLNTVREYLEGKQVQGVTENNQRGDSLVTDALKIMRGSDYQIDPARAIKTVLGEREYNSRRGFYNFYIKQLRDMYDQEGLAEGKRNLKCVCKTQGTLQCPVHTPKDIEVIEGAKVDRMVKHVAQSEKKLGHSKKEAENIAWATANKRGMLDNKNKKA
jgi:hypothetical protein